MVRSIQLRREIRDPAELESYEQVTVDGQTRWMKVRGSVEGMGDVLRQQFGGSTSSADIQQEPTLGYDDLRGEYRKVAYTSAWRWGAGPSYKDKYDLKVYFWIPPGEPLDLDRARSIANQAFDAIPSLGPGTSVNTARGLIGKGWRGYSDDVIQVDVRVGKPSDYSNVNAEYKHEKDGATIDSWGPQSVGVNPYLE